MSPGRSSQTSADNFFKNLVGKKVPYSSKRQYILSTRAFSCPVKRFDKLFSFCMGCNCKFAHTYIMINLS